MTGTRMQLMKSTITNILIIASLFVLRGAIADTNMVDSSNDIIRLATTTSTDNSGLLSYLLPAFENKTGYRVHVIAVGTGKALRMGRDGDADVLLVHAPEAEKEFVESGYGENRHYVMYNDFVLVGPASVNAAVQIDNDISKALRQIAESKSTFISRGDNSGTHKKELSLWKAAGIKPEGKWYREVGQGMGKVLQMASELDAYTLTDRGTWLAYMDKSPLKILSQGDPKLFNPYHIIAVNPKRYPDINYQGANALISWITSTSGQSLIGRFSINDTLLFKPSANAKQVAGHNASQ
jgi:tungstate transport system substrate-binding protein